SSGSHPAFTRFVGASAVYAINPLDEATARAMADNIEAAPVMPYDMQDRLKQMVEERMVRLVKNGTDATNEMNELTRY
ncbi:MAG TPA: hypothetical protein PL070_08660, partial [Flavobacteriales bacterium]|nr:hypothetical protein [Flavobacteriales bacterium]